MATKNRLKGVILAGGRGTRLRPLTIVTSKILLPIFDRPMISGPIDTLKEFGIRDICIVTSREHMQGFMDFLGNGSEFGIKFTYVIQEKALGNAHALLQAADFCKGSKVVVISGDNIFEKLRVPKAALTDHNAYIFIKDVSDPHRFGVAEMNKSGEIVGIEEKPKRPKTHHAITGLYMFPSNAFEIIRGLKPSPRGEIEIMSIIEHYMRGSKLRAVKIDGYWLDTGTFDSMLKASMLRAMKVNRDIFKGVDRKSLLKVITKT